MTLSSHIHLSGLCTYITLTQLFDQAHRLLQTALLQHKCLPVCPTTVLPTSTNSEPKSQKIL